MKKHLHWIAMAGLGLLIIGLVVFAILRFRSFLNPVSIDKEIDDEAIANYEDNYDVIMPLMDANGYVVKQEVKDILILGNDPFAQDRDSKDGMAAMLAEKTGAYVINCAISGTYATQTNIQDPLANPLDVYTPYYLSTFLSFPDTVIGNIETGANLLGENNPPDAAQVLDTLKNIDLNEIDMVIIFYDLTDYYLNHPTYITEIEEAADTFAGNILLAANMITVMHPHVRVICMSPYYNSFTDENGEHKSAELVRNDYGTPGDYVLSEGGGIQIFTSGSFVDNYFGSITEDNYTPYLRDNKNLSKEGRELLVDRLVYFINYYN